MQHKFIPRPSFRCHTVRYRLVLNRVKKLAKQTGFDVEARHFVRDKGFCEFLVRSKKAFSTEKACKAAGKEFLDEIGKNLDKEGLRVSDAVNGYTIDFIEELWAEMKAAWETLPPIESYFPSQRAEEPGERYEAQGRVT